ncbi:MAG: trypsin-like peptidase domain-containing protein [Candidatus Pacebacteria bacterium]|nr:trypsin-like peptidase domain-containing protein [Candidatus Paceibacterota bacterium]
MQNKKFIVILIILSLVFGFSGAILGIKLYPSIFPTTQNIETTTAKVSTSEEKAVINTVKKVSPAVVSVILTKDVPVFEEYWSSPYQFLPEYRQKGTKEQQVGGGTGFIISSDGMILTNKHVVSTEGVDYTVVLSDGKKYSAEILARDPSQDIAVLKIKAKNLTTVKLGDSDKIQVGQSVIAIGYALGEFQNTVSVGVVSGIGRTITAGNLTSAQTEELQELIQTDAAINSGNSGGPLLNLSGEVIGINTAMASGAENIGFSIPINSIKNAISEVEKTGKISYPFLGVNHTIINDTIKKEQNLSVNYGALVIKDNNGIAVVSGSAAEKAGLRENDIILEINGKKITEKNTLSKVILSYKVGDKIKLKVLRNGKQIFLGVTLQEKQ